MSEDAKLNARLDEIALEFASGALTHLVTRERIEKHYAPLFRELLEHGILAARLSRPSPSEDVARLEAAVAQANFRRDEIEKLFDKWHTKAAEEHTRAFAAESDVARLSAEWRSDDSQELQEVYNALGIGGNFSAIDEIRALQARAFAAESDAARLTQVKEILEECADDFHVCEKCGHQDDTATRTSNLYLLLEAALIGTGDGWRTDLENAKDGTPVWLYREDCDPFLGRWIAPVDFMTADELEEHNIPDAIAEEADWFFSDFVAGGRVVDGAPTHWRPLPSPPPGRETKTGTDTNGKQAEGDGSKSSKRGGEDV